jgi:hypothetical protein
MTNLKLVVAFTAVLCVAALVALAAPEDNLISLHRHARLHQGECTACHGERTDELATDGKSRSFHTLHLTSPLLKFDCVVCHQSVDLREGSAASLRKQVNPKLCARCHSPWPAVKAHTDKTRTMCASCHSGWRKQMAKSAPEVTLDKVTAKDCYGCHGGRTLYVKPKGGARGRASL